MPRKPLSIHCSLKAHDVMTRKESREIMSCPLLHNQPYTSSANDNFLASKSIISSTKMTKLELVVFPKFSRPCESPRLLWGEWIVTMVCQTQYQNLQVWEYTAQIGVKCEGLFPGPWTARGRRVFRTRWNWTSCHVRIHPLEDAFGSQTRRPQHLWTFP